MARPEVHCGVGHMCRFGVTAPVSACAGAGPVRTGAGRLPVRKPTCWMSSCSACASSAAMRVCPPATRGC
eukprot:4369420-Alexandrium_andersonii.AAC.1